MSFPVWVFGSLSTNIQDSLFFLLDKETYMLTESITNLRYSIFSVGMNWDFDGCITNPKAINNSIIFETFLKHDA